MDVVEITHNNNNEIEKVVCENSYKKITFFRNKKADIEDKMNKTSYTTEKSTNNKVVPVDIATIEEILLNNPSKKGYTAQQIYGYCNNKNWFSEKQNKAITAETIKFYLEKGWF